jgi:hypothetical protein
MSSFNTTVADLEEYRRSRPLVETLKTKDEELEREKKRRINLEAELLEKDEELENERERRIKLEAELLEKEYEWSIHEDEIKRINQGLEIPIDPPELCELAKDLFHHPSKYTDIVRTMRELQSSARIRANLTDPLVATDQTSANLTNADLRSANLMNTKLLDANLTNDNLTNAKLITDVNPLSGIKLCNVETDNRIVFQNANPTSTSPSSIVTDIAKESAARSSIHKITRYTSDGKPINQ